jgi:hypothetical protein
MVEPPSVVHGQGSVEPKRGNGDLNAGVNRRRKGGGAGLFSHCLPSISCSVYILDDCFYSS